MTDLLPHAPRLGLYVAPEIPADKLRAAIRDYAPDVRADDVLVLYDATRFGSAKDGALFLADRFVFQNTDAHPPLTVRYDDLVRVEEKRNLLGGRRVAFDVNRGRATTTEALDFAVHAEAAPHVARFLTETLHASADRAADARAAGATGRSASRGEPPVFAPETPEATEAARTDVAAVRAALDALLADGRLAPADHACLVRTLHNGDE